MLMYFVLPLWLAAGFADYLCHQVREMPLRNKLQALLPSRD
jgi:hypothetical protein